MDIQFSREHLKGYVTDKDFHQLAPVLARIHEQLESRTGKGREYTGWITLPRDTDNTFLDELMSLGDEARAESDCLVSVGIGGSYIGIRAALDFLSGEQKLPVYYAGHNMNAEYYAWLLKELEGKRVTVVVISKSGTTTEPALAFRILKKFMEGKYKKAELARRIICVTDASKGALRTVARQEGYRSFVIPDDIGGRFSVLSAVGLVPLAIAGIDIYGLLEGGRRGQEIYGRMDLGQNAAYEYAAARYLLYQRGKKIEVLANFYEQLAFLGEWWKQLFGESEGKEGKGVFPAYLNFSADLHSMGQMLQEGERTIFETFLMVERLRQTMAVPAMESNLDNFNCVAGKDIDYVNKQAYKATALAHVEGGVPNMTISIPAFDAFSLGQLFYFFEKAVAVSGYLLDVNPFDQPGVEAYKKKMFQLLGRPA